MIELLLIELLLFCERLLWLIDLWFDVDIEIVILIRNVIVIIIVIEHPTVIIIISNIPIKRVLAPQHHIIHVTINVIVSKAITHSINLLLMLLVIL